MPGVSLHSCPLALCPFGPWLSGDPRPSMREVQAEQAMRQYNMDSNISTIVADEMPPVFDVIPSNIPEESFENMELNDTNQENIQMTFSDGSEPEQTSSVVFT